MSVSCSGRVRRSPDRLGFEKEREEEQQKELQVKELEREAREEDTVSFLKEQDIL